VVPKNDLLWYGYENSQQRYEIYILVWKS
jgi:hypothetical protein